MGCGGSHDANVGADRSFVSGSGATGTVLTSKEGQKVGFFSYHGWEKQGMITKTVKPKINQDRIFITPKACNSPTTWVFAVYDGNGPKGQIVAQEAGAAIVDTVENSTDKVSEASCDVSKVLTSAFLDADKKVCKMEASHRSGCTATVIVLQDLKTFHIANVGDSKAVLGKATGDKWVPSILTTEHKPSMEEEKKRITAAGGYVLEDEDYGAARVFDTPDPIGQMMAIAQATGGGMGAGSMGANMEPWPGLAMSRCIGHQGVAKIGIVAEPTCASHTLTEDDKVLIIASDGVWDFIEPEEACAMAKTFMPDAHAACKALVETASQRWIEDDPTYRDDISCIVVFLPLEAAESSTISHETISYTEDSAVALQAAKTPVVDVATGNASGSAGSVAPVEQSTEGMTDLQKKKAMIKANKEQMKRSVVTRYG